MPFFGGQGGDTLPISDTTGVVKGSADPTKILRIEVDGFTTATTRVMTPPNEDFTVVGVTTTQTLTNKTLTSPKINEDVAVTATATELNYTDGVTSAIQTQLNTKSPIVFEAIVAGSGGDYTTLGAAIAAGKTRIFVRNGTYTETGETTIPSGVRIIGESRDGAIISTASTTNDRLVFSAGTIANFQLENITISNDVTTDWILEQTNTAGNNMNNSIIRNVRFTNGSFRIGHTGSDSYNLVIEDNIFTIGSDASNNHGTIFTTGTAAGWVRICNNFISGSGAAKVFSTSGAFTEFIFAENILQCTGADVIVNMASLGGAESLIFANNSFVTGASSDQAIQVTGSASTRLVVTGNYFNGKEGINFSGCESTTITGNTFDGNDTAGSYGITTNSDDVIVVGNNFIDCAIGIDMNGAERMQVDGNRFESCTVNISTPGVNNNITRNNFGLSDAEIHELRVMKNTSGGQLDAGDLVVRKAVAAGDEVTTTTTAGDRFVFGMAVETVADAAYGLFLVYGKTTALKVNGTTDIAIGDYLAAFTTAKIAYKATVGDLVTVGDTAIAYALEAYTTNDSSGVIDAIFVSPLKI